MFALSTWMAQSTNNALARLHSAETRTFMNKFIIGRIEGRWKNFVPPIQGGKFRSREELECETQIEAEVSYAQHCVSSAENSTEPSPVFEAAEHPTSSTRRRDGKNTVSRSSSVTSMSSVELDGAPKMSHIDIRTREELELDISIYPSLDPTTQDSIVEKYRALGERVRAEGLYQCNYLAYARECCRYSLLFAGFLYFLRRGWYILSALSLGLFWHQLTFTAHDAGHMGITHSFTIDTLIGVFVADFLGGLSIGWWKRNHNVHHIVTNSPEHDPDIQHMPFFAVSHRFLESLRSSYYDRVMAYDPVAKTVIRIQNWLYYPILALGRVNLYRRSWEYLLLGQAPRKGPAWWTCYIELIGQCVFWYWFGYLVLYLSVHGGWNRFAFVMVSHIAAAPVHVQIVLSHFAMSTSDLGVDESFPQKMLRTTMDVDCPEWLDWVHGGLQFQIVHHLFPRMPRHNLRKAQKLVIEYCEEVNIPYAIYGWADGNQLVISRLEEVARQAKILAQCQRAMVRSGDLGMH